ncbi:unnamed protein product [Acanthoscelides obtectus]|uniref:SCAN domain-containing protein 3 n=1 Tax=Acanthoscelides obtectus TaxID=200917 RepID=A0A9P0KBU0_ACAOB|nr:unnamed protein product [Acanthoscelides obtectus]CAK1646824.1 SCAN domain-containing protein 3 [Acanthoscelides obtectus]
MNQEIYEELLFARTLITDTKGELIFHVLKDYFIEKAIPLSNIISVATDGAPAMVGRYRGFISYLKQNLSGTSCQEDDVSTYVQHLNALYSDFESRFEDILTMVIPPWIINPYGDIEEANDIIQEELTELSTNEELKVQFKNGYQQFWLKNNIPVTYPNIARKFLISFPSSYLVERGFSAVINLLTKKRNRLDIISRGDLRLTLTKLTPNVDNLLLKHQVHPSH